MILPLLKKFKKNFKKKKYLSKLVSLKFKDYKKIKSKIKNDYLKSSTNDENMNFVYALSKLLKISENSFIKFYEFF